MKKRRTLLGTVDVAALGVDTVAAGRVSVRLLGVQRGKRGLAARPFDALTGHMYVELTTFRRSGEAVPTPVWFAVVGDRLYVGTDPESGKMKRIRNDPRVVLRPSNAWGRPRSRSVEGIARPIEGDAPEDAKRALFGKYRLELAVARLFGVLPSYRPTLEIRLAEPGS